MVQEAEQHAEEDRRRRELVEARNVADATMHSAEKQLQEHGGQVSEAERRPVEEAIAALREAVSGDNTAGIRQRLEALSQALTRLGEAIHRAAAAQPEQPAPGCQAATGAEDVVTPNSRMWTSGGTGERQLEGASQPWISTDTLTGPKDFSSRRRSWRCAAAISA